MLQEWKRTAKSSSSPRRPPPRFDSRLGLLPLYPVRPLGRPRRPLGGRWAARAPRAARAPLQTWRQAGPGRAALPAAAAQWRPLPNGGRRRDRPGAGQGGRRGAGAGLSPQPSPPPRLAPGSGRRLGGTLGARRPRGRGGGAWGAAGRAGAWRWRCCCCCRRPVWANRQRGRSGRGPAPRSTRTGRASSTTTRPSWARRRRGASTSSARRRAGKGWGKGRGCVCVWGGALRPVAMA